MHSRELDEGVKDVFLAVMGTSPAVLTECMFYYYSDHYNQLRSFSEIKVLTTSIGKQYLVDSLFTQGRWSELESSLGLVAGTIPFEESDILVFENLDTGEEVADLLSSADNEAASYLINTWVKHFTDQDDYRLTATVAGGRKTQSALMALAFQLYGRQQDELIHVIVSDQLMANKDWFFPSDPTDSEQKLSVSDVPILRVGRYLSRNTNQSPDELAREIQESLLAAQPIEEILIEKNYFTLAGVKFRITPREASYYRYLLKRRLNAPCTNECQGCSDCCADRQTLLRDSRTLVLEEHALISNNGGHYHRTRENRLNTRDDMLINSIWEEISRLGSAIRSSDLHPIRREDIAPQKLYLTPGDRREVSYGVIVDPSKIHFLD